LITSGIRRKDLEKALKAIAKVDKRLSKGVNMEEEMEDLERRTETQLREWCAVRGIKYDSLSEEEFMALVIEGVKAVRRKGQ